MADCICDQANCEPPAADRWRTGFKLLPKRLALDVSHHALSGLALESRFAESFHRAASRAEPLAMHRRPRRTDVAEPVDADQHRVRNPVAVGHTQQIDTGDDSGIE